MKKIIYSLILTTLIVPAAAFAQTTSAGPNYTLLTPLPCVGTNGNSGCTGTSNGSQMTSINVQGYLVYIFKLAISLAVFLAVVMIIFAGFRYMSVESVGGKSEAKDMIKNAVYGLLLALSSYLILYTINPDLVNLSKITVPKLNVKTSSLNLNSNQPNNSPTTNTTSNADANADNPGYYDTSYLQ